MKAPTFSSSHGLVLLALVAAIGASGCFVDRTVTTTLPHPMQTGQIQQNRVNHEYARTENNHRIPAGSLTDEATLTRMDAEAICATVQLRAVTDDDGQTWSDLRNWEITLLSAPGETVLTTPTVEMLPDTAQQFAGRVPQRVQTGTETVCTDRDDESGDCNRSETRPVYQTRWVPGTVTVVSGGGNICFANPGVVSTQTQVVTLRLHRPIRNLNFEWQFQSIVQ